jgi:hypothetical protein
LRRAVGSPKKFFIDKRLLRAILTDELIENPRTETSSLAPSSGRTKAAARGNASRPVAWIPGEPAHWFDPFAQPRAVSDYAARGPRGMESQRMLRREAR